MEQKRKKTVKEVSLEFSIELIDYERVVSATRSASWLGQLVRSGTAIGAMIHEAQGAESRKDFIHKMKLAYKEAEETEYWLILSRRKYPEHGQGILPDLLIQLKKMLSSIISTCIANTHKPDKE